RTLGRDDVVHLEMQLSTVLWCDELDGRVRLVPEPLAVRLADAPEGDLKDLEAHFGQRQQRLVPVDALLHVDLRDRAEASALQRVDQQAGLDAVAGEERKLLQQRAASTLFAGEGLHHPRELREEQVEDRPRRELGDAPTAGRLQLAVDAKRSLIEGLH